MELREFAERVLFAASLEEKLAPPAAVLTDERPGEPLGDPSQPGRPDDLLFSRSGERAPLPAAVHLADDEERGRLLHFFANHELLAAELMALALLKFPSAPPAFRMGLAKTLQEEQMHTRLYLRRLEACGIAFGSQPVNGFFWKAVSSMQTPVDYVSRLSLTFEQANLDYARHFARLFHEAGDTDTAKVLDRIYRDEIGHVRYGLDWFRHWKEPGQSDWASFRKQLVFPLSPSRAKGSAKFNREGRRLAGLDDAFIDQLEVYTQSKGRTPNVFHFNPQAEWVIAREASGASLGADLPRTLRCLSEDLSALGLYLARQDDVVLMARKPSLDFLLKLRRAGFALPEIQERDGIDLKGRKLGQLRPWAWSPDSATFLEPLMDQAVLTARGWRPAWRELHSKMFSTHLAREGGFGRGRACRREAEVEGAIREIDGPCVLKAPYGLAGKGLRFLESASLSPADLDWGKEVLREQDGLVVEPWYDRVLDFSVHYDLDLRLLGYVRLHNDRRGRFQACSTAKPLTAGAGDEVTRFFYGKERRVQRFYEETLPALLRPHLERLCYTGPLGIDSMIAREPDGSLHHHPVIEINPRYTMGRVFLELARHVVKGERAVFQILTAKHLAAMKMESFTGLADQLQERSPLRFTTYQNDCMRLRSGALVLNDPAHAQSFLAVLRVGQSAEPLLL